MRPCFPTGSKVTLPSSLCTHQGERAWKWRPCEKHHCCFSSELGAYLASRGVAVVYGGSRFGCLGLLADAVDQAGGKLTGILPAFFTGTLITGVDQEGVGREDGERDPGRNRRSERAEGGRQ